MEARPLDHPRGRPLIHRNPGCGLRCTPDPDAGAGGGHRSLQRGQPWLHPLCTIHPDIKRTLVGMSERTGMTVSQVTDEVLYTGLIGMQEMDLPEG